MKLALTGVALLVIMFAVATSCSITKKSGDYACTSSADCNSGRECSEGFCVLAGTSIDASASIDAPHTNPDGGGGSGSSACPAGCTSCDLAAKTCTIDCAAGADCSATVKCPEGYKCDVKCDEQNGCRQGVICGGATSCTVECSSQGTCQGVVCGAGKCDVQCTGQGSCKGVSCGTSCACDVECTGTNSCGQQQVQCTANVCRKLAGGCSSTQAAQCDSCP